MLIRDHKCPQIDELMEPLVGDVVLLTFLPADESTLESLVLLKSPSHKSLFQVLLHNLGRYLVLGISGFGGSLSQIDFKLGILFGVVAEQERLFRLNCIAKPRTKVIVIHLCHLCLCIEFDSDLHHPEIHVVSLGGSHEH